jgi:hypothetical protein
LLPKLDHRAFITWLERSDFHGPNVWFCSGLAISKKVKNPG